MTIEKRLERIEAILDARGLDWDHPRVASDHFADANKMVAEEPKKKWRIREPGEEVQEGDLMNEKSNLPSDPPNGLGWKPQIFSTGLTVSKHDECVFARPVADEPAKEPEPAWEPKVGDWVRVTRPENWQECRNPDWSTVMHQYDDNVMQVSCYEKRWGSWVANFYGVDWFFHRDWLSPAEPPAIDKPPEPEYREPVLPADVGKVCEFSINGNDWTEAKLQGYAGCFWISVSSEGASPKIWDHARIKKDA